MFVYVLGHDESFLVNPNDPIWQHYEPFKWWLLPHGVAGACALLLGPMQFSDRLRNRFKRLHCVVGRIYVAGVFVAAPFGFYIQYFQERMGDPRSFSIAAAVDAGLWMTTTGIALVLILKGRVQEHRRWMTRSFAVALVFLEGRVIGGVTGWENLGVHANETIVWVCLAFSILSADLVLLWQELPRKRSALHRGRLLFRLSSEKTRTIPRVIIQNRFLRRGFREINSYGSLAIIPGSRATRKLRFLSRDPERQ
jgi:uncharacterized membrane protein